MSGRPLPPPLHCLHCPTLHPPAIQTIIIHRHHNHRIQRYIEDDHLPRIFPFWSIDIEHCANDELIILYTDTSCFTDCLRTQNPISVQTWCDMNCSQELESWLFAHYPVHMKLVDSPALETDAHISSSWVCIIIELERPKYELCQQNMHAHLVWHE